MKDYALWGGTVSFKPTAVALNIVSHRVGPRLPVLDKLKVEGLGINRATVELVKYVDQEKRRQNETDRPEYEDSRKARGGALTVSFKPT